MSMSEPIATPAATEASPEKTPRPTLDLKPLIEAPTWNFGYEEAEDSVVRAAARIASFGDVLDKAKAGRAVPQEYIVSILFSDMTARSLLISSREMDQLTAIVENARNKLTSKLIANPMCTRIYNNCLNAAVIGSTQTDVTPF